MVSPFTNVDISRVGTELGKNTNLSTMGSELVLRLSDSRGNLTADCGYEVLAGSTNF
jgi:hypothetical protein